MDPADLIYLKMICKLRSVVDNNISLFNLIIREGEIFHHYAEIRLRLLSLSDKKPDVKKSHRGPESAAGLLIASAQPGRA
ncbi:unnamed protein product [Hymenolepis diminuta]|uniref:Uncharacterized protein n=1 Tax=Hymenolepis diminuta TaxID=6216 RepID=A0A564Z0D7_HYMDI|nr:unnamed protein product [Hymenolepis diminuta]